MDFVCTWIYLDSPEESSEYPQVGKKSHLPDFQKVYWKCVAVFFACSTRFNPKRRHVLFTNRQPQEFPRVDGLDLNSFLKGLNVEIVTIPLRWQTPEGYFGKWRNQFYIFDILQFIESTCSDDSKSSEHLTDESTCSDDSKSSEHLTDAMKRSDDLKSSDRVTDESTCSDDSKSSEHLTDAMKRSDDLKSSDREEAAFVILDSDCIVNRPLDALFAEIRRHGLLALPMPYSETHNINGVTREDMRRIYAELDGSDPGDNPVYYGGEIFAATLPVIRQINRMAPEVWKEMMVRFREKRPKLNEEAHFLSYCYHKIGSFGSLEGFIKRIWTSPHYSNVEPEDARLPIWHLPSEKTGGIALVFKRFVADGKVAAPEDLGEYFGVPRRKKYLDLKHRIRYTRIYKLLKH